MNEWMNDKQMLDEFFFSLFFLFDQSALQPAEIEKSQ